MTDERHDLGEQRHLGADGGVVLEHALAGGRTDDDGAALVAPEASSGMRAMSIQPLRPASRIAISGRESVRRR